MILFSKQKKNVIDIPLQHIVVHAERDLLFENSPREIVLQPRVILNPRNLNMATKT